MDVLVSQYDWIQRTREHYFVIVKRCHPRIMLKSLKTLAEIPFEVCMPMWLIVIKHGWEIVPSANHFPK